MTGSPTFRILAALALMLAVTGCKAPDLKPDFLERRKEVVTPPQPVVDPSLTPRELLTARLVNARDADDAIPGMTVGKMIEFADRYLACDCADQRFAKSWARYAGGYVLATNAGQVRPLDFACSGPPEALECYLKEIDRGTGTASLGERYMSGGDFIRFVYEHGSRCERTAPCPAAAPAPAAAADPD
ncbi:MAG: hypothetical protein IT493_12590 [Gammaproteobacteria bacterium]|nr:hypothetical protein [Gammaproteobacteria bacterium]